MRRSSSGASHRPQGRLQVPDDSAIVRRRNEVLKAMLTNRHLTLAGDELAVPGALLTDQQINSAMSDPVIIAPDVTNSAWRAPQFVWQVRHQLGAILCGADQADTCEQVDTNGFIVTTTLDWKMQQMAEKWVAAAGIAPNAKSPTAYLKSIHAPNSQWIRNLIGRGVFNAALGAS